VGIEHGKDLWTFYYHGRERTQLRQGQRVKAGDFIYTSGNTGASTGAHLHFETRKSRRWGHTIDPVHFTAEGHPVAYPASDRQTNEANLGRVAGRFENPLGLHGQD
jgi:murein DD-endopeptidase